MWSFPWKIRKKIANFDLSKEISDFRDLSAVGMCDLGAVFFEK